MISGELTNFDEVVVNNIFRINTDGTRDLSFDITKGFLQFGSTSFANRMIETPDSKFYLLVGQSVSYTGLSGSRNGIIRINNDGNFDSTFPAVTMSSSIGQVSVIDGVLQSDGKLVVIGNFTTLGGLTRRFISRVNANGTVDATFTPGNGFDFSAGGTNSNSTSRIKMQSDGKFIVVGQFTLYNNILANRIVRINTNGSYDTSFVTGSGFNNTVDDIEIGSDGKIYLVGNFTYYNGNQCIRYCVLDSNGTFIPTGIQFSERPSSIFIKE
jgi:uncharacterized delta-60 repeat protein